MAIFGCQKQFNMGIAFKMFINYLYFYHGRSTLMQCIYEQRQKDSVEK